MDRSGNFLLGERMDKRVTIPKDAKSVHMFSHPPANDGINRRERERGMRKVEKEKKKREKEKRRKRKREKEKKRKEKKRKRLI